MVPSQKYIRNSLLSVLSNEDYEVLRPSLVRMEIGRGDVLLASGRSISEVFFVEVGVVSSVAITPRGRRIEIGLVGREGFAGLPLALGVDRAAHESFVQIEGEALSLSSGAFREALDRLPALMPILLRYAHVIQVQTAQTALSNGSYSLAERLARWLLMCHDRIDGDEFPITHEFMAIMLGVRRPGVTTTVHVLEGAGMIKARRSRIEILDRAKLEAMAGESYGLPEAEYRRLIGPPGRAHPRA